MQAFICSQPSQSLDSSFFRLLLLSLAKQAVLEDKKNLDHCKCLRAIDEALGIIIDTFILFEFEVNKRFLSSFSGTFHIA
jgi:hypothetical protein